MALLPEPTNERGARTADGEGVREGARTADGEGVSEGARTADGKQGKIVRATIAARTILRPLFYQKGPARLDNLPGRAFVFTRKRYASSTTT